MPGVTLDIRPGGDLHKRIINAVMHRVKASKTRFDSKREKWKANEEAFLAYMPEREIDAERRRTREGGKPQYTTIQVPYSYAILMAAHTYWTTVFLSRNPVLQYTGRHGESSQQVQAVEALIDYQVQVGGALVPWYIWLHDAGKYGVGILGTFWDEVISTVSEIVEEDELLLGTIPTGRKKKRKITSRIPGYTGNRLYNVRPQDFYPDPRVPMYRFQDGEFVGIYNEIGWNSLLERAELGYYTNLDRLRGNVDQMSGDRVEGSSQIDLSDPDSFGINFVDDKRAADVVRIYECYINLVPSKWGLGRGDLPEKWVFTVTADYKYVIGAQPLGAHHNRFPFNVIEIEPEGYGLVNRGIPEIVKPVQDTIDWLINSHFYNVRKVLNDQFIVDPSRITMKDVLDPQPGGTFRLRPSAYGTNIRDNPPISQLPVTDVTQNHLRDLQMMLAIGERVSGVNDQVMGLLQQGGRKTASEVRTSSAFSVNRLKTTSEYVSAMGWTPMSQMLLQNSQQYYDAERKFRLVGDLANEAGPKFINVTPDEILGFYDFVPVDGALPIDRLAQANLWRELFAQMRNFPQIMEQYDVGRIFAWVAQLTGLKNINQFRIQVQPDGMLATQAQQGNVVPLGGLPDMERNRGLRQVPGQGQVL